MRAFRKIERAKRYFSIFAISLRNQKTCDSPKVPYSTKTFCLEKQTILTSFPCMLARNDSLPLSMPLQMHCNRYVSVLSRNIRRTQRTTLHRRRRWRLLSSRGWRRRSQFLSTAILLRPTSRARETRSSRVRSRRYRSLFIRIIAVVVAVVQSVVILIAKHI